MCGRYTLSRPAELIDELEDAFDDELEIALDAAPPAVREELLLDQPGTLRERLRPRFNLAPTQAAPVVRNRPAPDGPSAAAPQLAALRWGLQPAWRKRGRRAAAPLINARVETAAEKPSFAESLAQRRCLVPADGFYEWSPRDRGHQPHWLTLGGPSPQPVCFAGLWDDPSDVAGADPGRFTILTTRACPSVAPLHDRMPIALPHVLWRRWLDAEQDAEDAVALLHTDEVAAFADWSARPVGRAVNRVANDHAGLLEEADLEPQNLSLF